MSSSTLESGTSVIANALEVVLSGKPIETSEFLITLQRATLRLKDCTLFRKITGDTIVFGPCRGHAADLAHYLLKKVLSDIVNKPLNVIFLGNYVDGGHQSMELLYIVAVLLLHLPSVTLLVGQHEMLYPFPADEFGSLKGELRLRSLHAGVPIEDLENVVKGFFSELPVACVINDRFFCSAGGIASRYPYLHDIAKETSQSRLSEFVENQPMDEEEDKMAVGCAFMGSISDERNCLRYTFNAICNFISRNGLYTHIGGLEYHIYRPEFDSFARSNHFKESTYFPGYALGRIHHELRVPSYILLFSAPHFCGVNQNSAGSLIISGNTVELHRFEVYRERPVIMPGEENHAFAWSQLVLEKLLVSFMKDILFGGIQEPVHQVDDNDIEYIQGWKIATAKFRRVCQLLKSHSLPVPFQLKNERENDTSNSKATI